MRKTLLNSCKGSRRGRSSGKHNFPIFKTLRNSVTNFQCQYPTGVSIANTRLAKVKNIIANDAIIAKGSLKNGFSMEIYKDSEYQTPVNTENVTIGQTLYPEVSWSLDGLGGKLNFFVKSCKIHINETHQLEIVKDNCYAHAVSAKLESSTHLQRFSSRFSFKSFSNFDQTQNKQKLVCQIRICSTKSMGLLKRQKLCPTGSLNYRLF